MEPQLKAIEWEALEHHHEPKKGDWFWVLGIIALSGAVTAVLMENILLAIVILIGAAVMSMLAMRPAQMVRYGLNQRGIKIDNSFYPYTTLESFYIEDDPIMGHQLLLKSQKLLMPLLILPLPEDDVEEIERILAERIPEEHLEEPLANKILEFFGF